MFRAVADGECSSAAVIVSLVRLTESGGGHGGPLRGLEDDVRIVRVPCVVLQLVQTGLGWLLLVCLGEIGKFVMTSVRVLDSRAQC